MFSPLATSALALLVMIVISGVFLAARTQRRRHGWPRPGRLEPVSGQWLAEFRRLGDPSPW